MKVVIIGSGNVATHLARALHLARVSIVQVWSYQKENAAALAVTVDAKPIEALSSIDSDADLAIISVKDDAIAEVAREITGFKGTVVHTSGAVPMDIFDQHFDRYGVFYPLQTFSKSKTIEFENIPLCVEANNDGVVLQLKDLASQLSNNVKEISGAQRKILHLAAVFACNFPNHLFAIAGEILDDHGLDFDILRPLIYETALKVQTALPSEVQTGPAIRKDERTLTAHQELLKEWPQFLEIYRSLSESIKKTR